MIRYTMCARPAIRSKALGGNGLRVAERLRDYATQKCHITCPHLYDIPKICRHLSLPVINSQILKLGITKLLRYYIFRVLVCQADLSARVNGDRKSEVR
ncbi:hypothetical protein ACH3XW_50505 [Acanthocheilonema viteae]